MSTIDQTHKLTVCHSISLRQQADEKTSAGNTLTKISRNYDHELQNQDQACAHENDFIAQRGSADRHFWYAR